MVPAKVTFGGGRVPFKRPRFPCANAGIERSIMLTRAVWSWICIVLAGAAVSACAGGSTSLPKGAVDQPFASSTSTPIQHVVLMIQENRSFNDLFATFPGVMGTTTGWMLVGKGKHAKKKSVALTEVNLFSKTDLNHLYKAFVIAYNHGKMDAFNKIVAQDSGKPEGTKPYQYVNPAQVQPYYAMATGYAIADKMFQTQGGGSFTAHQDLIRGGTELSSTTSMVDDPTSSQAWGCDSPAGTVTDLITTKLQYEKGAGPFPCTDKFPSSAGYRTLRDLLDGAGVSWKYYVPQFAKSQPGALWNAFDVIYPVRYGSEWGTNVSWPEKNIFNDISSGTLPAMSWVIPDESNSDHPGYGGDTGPSWVASVVDAIGQSSYWNSTAIIIVWDDWGGFYDPVSPPKPDNQGGPGSRVPMIVVSPYVLGPSCAGGQIASTLYEFGSIVRFIEDTWNLGRLGTTDETATSIANMFNFAQSPCPFQMIPSKYSRSFFLHQKPSGLPVDTE